MGKPIQKGDLVMVVRADHSCAKKWIGKVFIFNPLSNHHPGIQCYVCGERNIAMPNEYCHGNLRDRNNGAFPARWLIRIDPPATGDSLPTRKDIKEPA